MALDERSRAIRRLAAKHAGNACPLTQADRIIVRFGGVANLVSALAAIGRPRTKVTVYRWNHPRSKGGCGGIIPSEALPDILAAARLEGILLSADELDPRPTTFSISKATKRELEASRTPASERYAEPENDNSDEGEA